MEAPAVSSLEGLFLSWKGLDSGWMRINMEQCDGIYVYNGSDSQPQTRRQGLQSFDGNFQTRVYSS